jgi:hypothetical protein
VEIDVTFLLDEDCGRFSGPIAELGDNAGRITWNNAMEAARSGVITLTPEQIQELKDYFGEFGAWDDEERAAWTDVETIALLIQMVAGDLREIESQFWDDTKWCIDWEAYEADDSGQIQHNLFFADGRVYYQACH